MPTLDSDAGRRARIRIQEIRTRADAREFGHREFRHRGNTGNQTKPSTKREPTHGMSLRLPACLLGLFCIGPVLSSEVARVVNGEESKITRHPWISSITLDDGKRCAGTWFTSNLVVTAAHCVREGDFQRGELSFATKDRTGPSRIPFSTRDVTRMPDEGRRTKDVAVIQLPMRVELSPQFIPILLPNATDAAAPGDTAVVSGWGVTCRDPPTCLDQTHLPNMLRSAEITVKNASECEFRKSNEWEFCAGGRVKGVPIDSCDGDSGGPLECATPAGDIYLCGIVSTGPSPPNCGFKNGIYVNVSHEDVRLFLRKFTLKTPPRELIKSEDYLPPPTKAHNQAEIELKSSTAFYIRTCIFTLIGTLLESVLGNLQF